MIKTVKVYFFIRKTQIILPKIIGMDGHFYPLTVGNVHKNRMSMYKVKFYLSWVNSTQ